jgi:hypothetical protein
MRGENMTEPVTNAAADTKLADSASKTGVVQSGAAVGASGAGATTGVAQTDAGATQRAATVQAESVTDVGQGEAYILNMKKLVADELDHASNLRAAAADSIGRRSRNAEDYDQTLRHLAQQSLQSAVSLQSRIVNDSVDHKVRLQHYAESEVARTVRHSDLAIDRQWNVDEVAELVAKTPVFLDAIAGAVAAGVAKAVAEKQA